MLLLRSIAVFVISPLFLLGSANAYRPYAGTGDVGLLPRGNEGDHGHTPSQSSSRDNSYDPEAIRRVQKYQNAAYFAANSNALARDENDRARKKSEKLATFKPDGPNREMAELFGEKAKIHDKLATLHAGGVKNPQDLPSQTSKANAGAHSAEESRKYAKITAERLRVERLMAERSEIEKQLGRIRSQEYKPRRR